MEKKDLVKLLDEIFFPLAFKRKGNNWVYNGDKLTKLVNLQKSYYSNKYYINYGFIIKGLVLKMERMHVENRLGFIDKEREKRLNDLLDLEADMPQSQRLAELKVIVTDKIASQMLLVNNEKDILDEISKRPTLNDISLVVKRHLNLPLPIVDKNKPSTMIMRFYKP